ncbi:crotonobetainyl-CoA:carnitine CoA-transferase CaiB-like acyl-CoA transferase [Amycolatopsis bartoniae]|uniref:Putative CoA-transferase n=1 Tax=Amycolatopsis bartoniae TaxID=941986 RepID=A0A8H9INS5_9PSEU|nr:CoA transferase [Amycolatopsis bartoniae]MBB2940162.1 crotonobetainyl-CoA:carnitine CoA-transferase CaiB-like acyl-CoA transferase [Amycolatopsis bartoniae]TVT06264.1 CoA transferase [Amycolatopsis bartoniae]GHF36954.1 putative CoA-transferase [Amycolatopsis bartoniae]
MSRDNDVMTGRPLSGVRVVDAVDGPLQTVGRVLADLGAEVLRVEPPGGSPARRSGVVHNGQSLTFLMRNAGKHYVTLDLDTAEGRAEFAELAASADVVLRDEPRTGDLAAERLRERNSRLVVVEMTDFGTSGERAGWVATPDVHAALSTVLARSGLPDVTEPLLPPEFLLYESAAVQAVWVVLLELAHVRATGEGDIADFSVQEALIQILDPVFGVGGSARAGVPLSELPRGRPDARHLYPIFAARDGMVRICVLSKRQWRGMFEWLGRPAEFDDPKYDNTMTRFGAAPRLYPLIGQLFAGLTMEEAVEQGQQHGVPTAALASAQEVLAEKAFRENGSFVETTVDGAPAVMHSGWFELDDSRLPAQTGDGPSAHTGVPALPDARPGRLPFEGLRVLDLGVIVVGAELGRLFADYGADVIKIESSAFPDGARQTPGGELISEGTSWGMRNKRGLGLNLRSEDGKRVFADLVRRSDVVLTNFKPGTLASLGFDMDTLRSLNPGIILSESSAFGNHGSWSRRLGYGPLVRASAGLSKLWSYPDEDDGYSDAITIFPDHVVARLNAAAIVALLIRRDRTGAGGRVSTAQVDAIFGAMADLLLAESLAPGAGPRSEGNDRGGDAFRGIFPAAGDDEWLVVDAQGDERFAAVAKAIGRPDLTGDEGYATAAQRWARRHELRELLAQWSRARDPRDAAAELQALGVPAGAMLRVDDLRADAHLRSRKVFGQLVQPQLSHPLVTNLGEARTRTLGEPRLGPAPLAAEHTRQVMRDVLGLPDDEIQRLLDAGALEENPAVSAERKGVR